MGEQEEFDESAGGGGLLGNKKVLAIAIIGIVVLILTVGYFALSKDSDKKVRKKLSFEPVFMKILPEEAAKLREELSYEGFFFKTEIEGKFRNILIREDQVGDARVVMAQKGLPAGGVVGYEIFDEGSTLGATDFDKRIKLIRAISGELSRNISRIDSVLTARVQIVLPKEKVFSVVKPKVTASVLIQKKKGFELTVQQIKGIMHLVAASVEGLEPENVTIIDMKGNILSNVKDEEEIIEVKAVEEVKAVVPTVIVTQNFFELKKQIEEEIEEKSLKVLDNIYPVGSTYVAATVELKQKTLAVSPDVKRINLLVLVDTKKHNIRLTKSIKNTTYKSIAAVIGYVRGRDKIELRRGSVKKNMRRKPETVIKETIIEESKAVTEEIRVQTLITVKPTTDGKLAARAYNSRQKKAESRKRLVNKQLKFFNLKILIGVFVVIITLIVVSFIKKKYSSDTYEEDESVIDEDEYVEEGHNLEDNEEVNKIREMADAQPEKMANILKSWLTEDDEKSNEDVETEEDNVEGEEEVES